MSFSGLLVSAGTSTTNPDPNTLTTHTPYPTPYVNRKTVSAAWTSQGSKALFPRNAIGGQGQVAIPVQFVTSSAGATYTATMYIYNKLADKWVQPKDNGSFGLTGNVSTFIENPGDDPIFIQLSSISAGTVAIYFDNGLADAL